MKNTEHKAVAIVGVGAVLPDAPNASAFWENVRSGRYSIREVPADRWDTADYFDPDPKAPDKSYTKIGGWCEDWEWDPIKWRMPIPPKVSAAMDNTQKWAIIAAREALEDYGWRERPLDTERTAVILGNAMGGDLHLLSAARILFPEFAHELAKVPDFASLPEDIRRRIVDGMRDGVRTRLPDITEDTMPGELANIVAGRVAALFDLHGPNYIADAACASAMAAVSAAVEGLDNHDFDAVITGGVDANMAPSIFVKFCKIGALSATGTRPYADGADGFVMGEGAAFLMLKRLEDAEKSGDRIYAVIRGLGGSSDGKGKGITAPNPVGQRLAVQRAWDSAGLRPLPGDMIEGHGTSTRVGDVAELGSLSDAFGGYGLPPHSVALGSVKSNIGHLKGAAGAAGLLKAALSLHHRMLPPSLNFERPNPNIDWSASPFEVNTELRDWNANSDGVRRAGVSAFGFGGTNFHAVLEEYVPGRLDTRRKSFATASASSTPPATTVMAPRTPLRGALVMGADGDDALRVRLQAALADAKSGVAPDPTPPREADLRAAVRVAIDYGNATELAERIEMALTALEKNDAGRWKALRAKGIHIGRGEPQKVAFLFTGQGSQYVNMLRDLKAVAPIVADTYAEADDVMQPLLERNLTDFIFVDDGDEVVMEEASNALKQTEITQPAVLATETALSRLLRAYGVEPDMVMGHSLGEYGALVASNALSFPNGLRAVSARGGAMSRAAAGDTGQMAAAWGPIEEIQKLLDAVDGYVVIANINSTREAVIGGASDAVQEAMVRIREAGYTVTQIPVSHAFHTEIVAPAAGDLGEILSEMDLQPPALPIVANITGDFYPMTPGVEDEMVDILSKQVASPVQFVKGLNRLYDAGARVFVELGPKRALYGFADDVVGGREGVTTLFTNHPRIGDIESFNQALCGLYAAGLGVGAVDETADAAAPTAGRDDSTVAAPPARTAPSPTGNTSRPAAGADTYTELGRLFAGVLDRGYEIYRGGSAPSAGPATHTTTCITGASLGLPGVEKMFDDENVGRLLGGEQFIDVVSTKLREAMAEKNITRLVKDSDGDARFETIDRVADVIKLAARGSDVDLVEEFGYPEDRLDALDLTTRIAMAAGIDALRDAGIPLVMRYKTTTTGSKLPERWGLPENMRDDTGVVFASAFPGYDSFAGEMTRFHEHRERQGRLSELESLRDKLVATNGGNGAALREIESRIGALRAEIDKHPFRFNRRFLFRVLAMGHSQFAEYIGARGPNTSINGACASATQATALADRWIRSGACRRVIVISADNITSDNLMGWFGSGFLASGAAATDEIVEEAAIPFDRRRHGLVIGMGGASLVVESREAARERGIAPIADVLATAVANSAFHGTRLDVEHICQVMDGLVSRAERDWGIDRREIAGKMVFVSHETYTPARGGSAAAEAHALRHVFGAGADEIVIANTKGVTGHPMGVGIEDAAAVKMLETGIVPPVPNFKELDPDLGRLNLSRGGTYPVEYALRLAAGFGSQIGMTLTRRVPTADGGRRRPDQLGYGYRIADRGAWDAWLREASGIAAPELEVERRTLRVRDDGSARRAVPAHTTEAPRPPEPVAPSPEPVPASTTAPTSGPSAETAVSAGTVASPEAISAPEGPGDPVEERVMAIIAEKSGYPVDMLDADLDLEADLGIDTVKQAEMFAAIREAYDIPRDENLKLRDFPTLAHTVQFVYDRRPDLAARAATAATAPRQEPAPSAPRVGPESPPKTTAPAAATTVETSSDGVTTRVLEIIAEKSGYPVDMLEPDLDLEADLGIDTVKQAEMFAAIREAYDIPRDENLKLRDFPTLAHTVQFVYDKRPDLAPGAASSGESATGAAAADPPAPSATPVEPAASSPSDDDEVREAVLRVVSEKTGYPADMLELELDLEADLGVDTVKQAEIFAAIREVYDIPRDENLKLRDFPTLAHTIQFVHDRRPAAAASVPEDATPIASPEPPTQRGFPRRVPVPVLRPELDLCASTGVDLAEGARVIVVCDRGGVGKALVTRLEKRGVDVLALEDTVDGDDLTRRASTWVADAPLRGVYWLPALDGEALPADTDVDGWRDAATRRVKNLYGLMRTLGDAIGAPGSFMVSATRLGGRFGYDGDAPWAPLSGAVSGFTKAYKRETPDALVKVIDFAPGRKTAAPADRIIDETLADPGVVEVGYHGGRRWTIGLEEREAAAADAARLDGDSVFVVTGAAGSIVSAITLNLAAGSGGTFHLLDLTPEPDRDDEDLRRFAEDREGLKRDVFERIKEEGGRATPVEVEKRLAGIERRHAALAAIEAVENAGGVAHYYCVDLTDAGAVASVMERVRETSGRIDVLVHAAGVEISHLLPDKEPREFDLVFDVKCDGWFNILAALGDMPLGTAVAFSSIAGRFGNAGQVDYSAANDLLCKSVAGIGRVAAGTVGLAIDWTAWSGIGMASRGSIPTVMKQAGIDMLPPEIGVPVVRRELLAATRGEVVVAGSLGIMTDEVDDTGGLDVGRVKADRGVMTGRVVGMGVHSGLVVETRLDPSEQPFLHDHRIGDTPVLPGVMGIEAMIEAAGLPYPDLRPGAIEDVNFLIPFKFYRNEPRTVRVRVVYGVEDGDVIGYCRLLGERALHGRDETEVTTHFTARVRLVKRPPKAASTERVSLREGGATAGDIYRVYFHGPAYRVVENTWRDGAKVMGLYANGLPANHSPADRETVSAPRFIELCFQTAGIAELAERERMGLPYRIGRVEFHDSPDAATGRVVAAVTGSSEDAFDASIVDEAGHVYLTLSGYRTMEMPDPVEPDLLLPLKNGVT